MPKEALVGTRVKYRIENVDEVNGLYWGGGLDVPFMKFFVLGGRIGYNQFFESFAVPVNGQTDYSGMEYSVGLGFVVILIGGEYVPNDFVRDCNLFLYF